MVELIWDGKYDRDGQRAAPLKVALPFQTVETVNESAQQRQRSLFSLLEGRDPEWRNRLIWGDKKYVLPSLLPEFAGQVDLVYIDPPFATGQDFSFEAQVGDDDFTKQPSMIETKAYRDTWGRGFDGYLAWFYDTATFLYDLLSAEGSIYVHLDWRVSHSIKLILDEIFGEANFINEIIWKRRGGVLNQKRQYGAGTDTLLFYSKTQEYVWHQQYTKHDTEEYTTRFKYVDEDGRRYSLAPLVSPNPRPNLIYEYKGYQPPRNGWSISLETMIQFDHEGRLFFPDDKTKRIRRKQYFDEWEGRVVQSLWDDIYPINSMSNERLGYDTQKPETLLERIIQASSNEGHLILDCFCGSGTTAAVAEKLGRRWIACDLGRFAIHTTRKRLLGIPDVRPFVVQNLGKYERQVWQQAEFGARAEATVRTYRRFILDLYHAEAIEGYVWLHGKKGGRMVHVGSVDSPVAPGDIRNIAAEFRQAIGTGKDAPKIAGVDVLGWDFALDTNETMKQIAQEAGLHVKFVRIPRQVLDEREIAAGDIQFFELAALSVDVKVKGREVTVKLTDFMVPPDDVPQDVIKVVKKWSEWIDYWAVDFNYKDDTFHNEWQSYRTRQDRSLKLDVRNKYEAAGKYTILVKVIDILGNDTTKAIEVEIV